MLLWILPYTFSDLLQGPTGTAASETPCPSHWTILPTSEELEGPIRVFAALHTDEEQTTDP